VIGAEPTFLDLDFEFLGIADSVFAAIEPNQRRAQGARASWCFGESLAVIEHAGAASTLAHFVCSRCGMSEIGAGLDQRQVDEPDLLGRAGDGRTQRSGQRDSEPGAK
jgi:hypothetical protein